MYHIWVKNISGEVTDNKCNCDEDELVLLISWNIGPWKDMFYAFSNV